MFRPIIFFVTLLFLGSLAHGGLTYYTDPGKTDFDTALEVLNPYGTWSKIDGAWAFTPLDHQAPYTHGRWIYTEYGWNWQGVSPHSWVTEHYGYWKRGADRVWSWYPGPYWLPETVEIRATSTHIGWRSAEVDHDGDFVEKPTDRWAKADEWTFVTRAQFAGPITPNMAASPDVAKELLDDSTESRHSYFTYRAIDRPGPHPADFISLCKDGGMFAPITLQDEAAAQRATPSPVKLPAGVVPPALLDAANSDPNTDKRPVKYWLTMSLPTYWSRPPADANPEAIYIYRPDFYQDDDGIARRILLWFNPKSRTTLQEVLGGNLPALKSDSTNPPAEPPQNLPFHSPLDDSYRPGSGPNSSSKNPTPPTPIPPNAPIPLPLINTNTAPVNPH